ncbi:MAG: cytochrome c oxidase subunit II [Acidobacteriota bacterium]|jgi:cytochrome c oxidase subunit II
MNSSATSLTGSQEGVFIYIVSVCAAALVIVTVLMIYFVIRYSRKNNPHPEDVKGNVLLETVWTIVPTILFISMFYFGWTKWEQMRHVPHDAMRVAVTAQQWSWSFKYPNGKESSILRLPVNHAVRCNLHSKDVIHGFFIPAFGVKEDVVPGLHNYVWFQPTDVGTYELMCSSYCGVGHPHMITQVKVMKDADFKKWYNQKAAATGAALGKQIYETKGCKGCHSLNGSKVVGPTWKGLYGSKVTVVTNGKQRTVTADDAYIERSILEPNADIVKGFPSGVMPSEKGNLSKKDIQAVIDYMKTLK